MFINIYEQSIYMGEIMNKKMLLSLLVIGLIAISSISIVSATMEIEGGAFFTDGGLDDLTYASIDVGSKYSGIM